MKQIQDIDKNFVLKNIKPEDDVVWFDVRTAPVDIYGFYNPKTEPRFHRLPKEVTDKCGDGVKALETHTAGGRVRFKTDSPYIAIKAEWPWRFKMANMSGSGSSGFDLFARENKNGQFYFLGAAMPPADGADSGFDSKMRAEGEMCEYILSFPLYNTVSNLYIGIKRGCTLLAGEKYKIQKPFVYYGSSITQGGCATRPSTCYQAYISHRFDADFINLGFSGSALGEEAMAQYIAGLDMSAFILDYDYNAPTAEHLKATHLPFYRTVREKQPDVPIVMVSRPHPVSEKSRDVIKATYDYAVAAGDKNVAFVDGGDLFKGDFYTNCTVDGCHPNDLGFYRMATVIGNALEGLMR